MTYISFFAAGIPKGQPRPRAFAMKFGNKYQARVYDAGTAEGWKSQVALAIKPHLPAEPITNPVRLAITIYMPRPKAHFKKTSLRENAPVFHVGKPDVDNHAKAIMDALTVIGLWRDDSQVVNLHITKEYSTTTGANITVQEIPNSGTVRPAMNRCHTCRQWRRLAHWNGVGLCKQFATLKINALEHDQVLSAVPDRTLPENFGLPTDGVITGFAFGCVHHTDNPPEKEEPNSFC